MLQSVTNSFMKIDYSTIRASGPDAAAFLQAQLSNDINLLDSRDAILAAWCNAKGRVICIFDIRRENGDFLLAVPVELAEDVVRRLLMFRFRSRVEFAIEPGATRRDIEGLPEIGRAQSEQFTPHMLNLDLLDAVSFDKGCYPGQEIVARTHYKGATKRRTMRFSYQGSVAVGDKVSDGNRDIGEVLNVAEEQLLAVVPVDKADATLSVNGAELTPQPLPYM